MLHRRQLAFFQCLEDGYPLIQKASSVLTGREFELESGLFYSNDTLVSSGGQKNCSNMNRDPYRPCQKSIWNVNSVMLTEQEKAELNCEGSAAPGNITACMHYFEVHFQKNAAFVRISLRTHRGAGHIFVNQGNQKNVLNRKSIPNPLEFWDGQRAGASHTFSSSLWQQVREQTRVSKEIAIFNVSYSCSAFLC